MNRPSRLPTAVAGLVITAGLAACSGPTDGTSGSDASPAAGVSTTSIGKGAATCAEKTLARMDRAQRVGQLMVVGVPVAQNREAAGWIGTYHLGGVLLTGSGTTTVDAAEKAITRLTDAAADGPRPFVASSLEGGAEQTLRGRDFADLPDAGERSGWSAEETTERVGEAARAAGDAGITMTIGPVADAAPDDTALLHATVQAIESARIATTLTRFPGPPGDDLTVDDPRLVPFVTGIEAGADVVMMSDAAYPAFDDRPAVFSSDVVTDLLRGIVGFRGVVLSSDLGDDGRVGAVELADRGVEFLEAGGDQVLSLDPRKAVPLLEGLATADQASPEFAQLVDAAALRILTVKAERDVITCG